MEYEPHTFNLSKKSFKQLKTYANQKSLSCSAILRILIKKHCREGKKITEGV